jgi:hypothetical protein
MDIYARNRWTDKISENELNVVSITPKYIDTFGDGSRGFLGFDITYWENYSIIEANRAGYRTDHVIVSLDCDKFAGFIEPNYRVFKVITGNGIKVASDQTEGNLVIANYDTLSATTNFVKMVNSIHHLTSVETLKNTPIRSLTDAWFQTKIQMSTDINAFLLRCKIRHIASDTQVAAVDKQFAIRYEVLISDDTQGSFILYEVEKSVVSGRITNETQMVEPIVRVKAVDGFSDEIVELFASRLSGRQTSFMRSGSLGSAYPSDYIPKEMISQDYMTFFQLGYNAKQDIANDPLTTKTYSLKIRPLSSLPASVDIQFYVQPFKTGTSTDVSSRTEPVTGKFNNIRRSEFSAFTALEGVIPTYIFGVPGTNGLLYRTTTDVVHFAKHLQDA